MISKKMMLLKKTNVIPFLQPVVQKYTVQTRYRGNFGKSTNLVKNRFGACAKLEKPH